MSDDSTLQALKDEVDRQQRAQAERHQILLDKLAEREARPLTQADASRTMANGYEQAAAEREGAKDGDDDE